MPGKKRQRPEPAPNMICPRCGLEVRQLPNGEPAWHTKSMNPMDVCE